MYDSYEFTYTQSNLDETYADNQDAYDQLEDYALDQDDMYARDTHDYQDLAYRHYA